MFTKIVIVNIDYVLRETVRYRVKELIFWQLRRPATLLLLPQAHLNTNLCLDDNRNPAILILCV